MVKYHLDRDYPLDYHQIEAQVKCCSDDGTIASVIAPYARPIYAGEDTYVDIYIDGDLTYRSEKIVTKNGFTLTITLEQPKANKHTGLLQLKKFQDGIWHVVKLTNNILEKDTRNKKKTCPGCNGQGKYEGFLVDVEDPCKQCGGSGEILYG